MGDPVGEIDVQPALDRVRSDRQQDLVERLVVQHLLDGGHRVVAQRDPAAHGSVRGVLDVDQGPDEHALGLGHLVPALGMPRMPFGGRGIRNQHAELRRPALHAIADRVEQRGRGSGPVSDDEDPRGLGGFVHFTVKATVLELRLPAASKATTVSRILTLRLPLILANGFRVTVRVPPARGSDFVASAMLGSFAIVTLRGVASSVSSAEIGSLAPIFTFRRLLNALRLTVLPMPLTVSSAGVVSAGAVAGVTGGVLTGGAAVNGDSNAPMSPAPPAEPDHPNRAMRGCTSAIEGWRDHE